MVGRTVGIAVVTAGLVLGCSSDDEPAADPSEKSEERPLTSGSITTSVPASFTAEIGAPLETQSIVVSDDRAVAIARVGDTILIVDGLHGLETGDEPRMQAWLVDAQDPATARPVDLGELGPYFHVNAVAWDDDVAISGVRCPDRVDPPPPDDTVPEPGSIEDACGTSTWDAFRLSTAGAVERVVTGEETELLVPAAITPDDRLLLATSDATLSVGLDAEVDRLPVVAGFVCVIGQETYAISQVRWSAPLAPVSDAFELHQLQEGAWAPVAVPASAASTTHVGNLRCSRNRLMAETIDVGVDAPSVPQGPVSVQLLTADGAGSLEWVALPLDQLPPDASGHPNLAQLVDGWILVSGLRSPLSPDQPVGQEPRVDAWYHAWNGSRWVDMGNDYGFDAYYNTGVVFDAVLTGDASLTGGAISLLRLGGVADGADQASGYYRPAQVALGP